MYFRAVLRSMSAFIAALPIAHRIPVESGRMTKDLAILIDVKQPWLTTEAFLDALDVGLKVKLAS